MTERPKVIVVKPQDMRCSNCVFGHEIVAVVCGGNIEDDDTETRWHLVEPTHVGQTRNCFGRLEIFLFHPERFIYPGEDDSCVKPKKFKPKTAS